MESEHSTEYSSKQKIHLPFKDRQPMRYVSDQTVSDPASQPYNQGLNTGRAVLSLAAFASPPSLHRSSVSAAGTGSHAGWHLGMPWEARKCLSLEQGDVKAGAQPLKSRAASDSKHHKQQESKSLQQNKRCCLNKELRLEFLKKM